VAGGCVIRELLRHALLAIFGFVVDYYSWLLGSAARDVAHKFFAGGGLQKSPPRICSLADSAAVSMPLQTLQYHLRVVPSLPAVRRPHLWQSPAIAIL